MTVPNQFANVTTSIPLSQLDANFNTPITLGNTAIQLGNTVSTLNNMTLANVTVTSGNVTITNVSVTTANVATANVTTSQILNYGTANQVQYLNASKALTGSANLTFDGTTFTHTGASNFATSTGNVGIGTSSPGYTASGRTVLQVNGSSQSIISLAYGGTNAWYAYADSSNTILYSEGSRNLTVGTVGAGNYVFATNNAEKMRLDSSGNLGLGVTPSAWGAPFQAFEGGDSNNQEYLGFQTNANAMKLGVNHFYNGSNYVYKFNGPASRYDINDTSFNWNLAASGTAGNAISFTQAMTLDASGNLLVGTTTAFSPLTVNGSNRFDTVTFGDITTASNNCGIYLRSTGAAGISWAGGGYLAFFGGGVGSTERARITSDGDFLVGTTSQISGGFFARTVISSADVSLEVSTSAGSSVGAGAAFRRTNSSGGEQIRFVVGGSTKGTDVGSIDSTSSATSYNTSSDYRLKEDVQPMVGALEKIAALKPVTYKWKVDGSQGEGFIAHELQEVCPQAVTGKKDDVYDDGSIKPQGIDTSFLVATLTAAIQEQQAMIDELKAKVAALENA